MYVIPQIIINDKCGFVLLKYVLQESIPKQHSLKTWNPKKQFPAGGQGLLSLLEAPTRTKGPPFVPVGGSTRDKRVTLLSRLVAPIRTKGPFWPGWCYQPGQKDPPRDSSKESYSILSHMYYLGELARKPCAKQEVLGSNPTG